MKLERVVFALSREWDVRAEQLEAKLFAEGIRCIRFDGGRTMYRKEFSASDTVVITNDRGLAAAMAEWGTVCIGCDAGEEKFFEGAVLVTDAPEILDAHMLEECLLRATGRPVTIAVTERLTVRDITEKDLEGLYRMSRQSGARLALKKVDGNCLEPEQMEAYIKYAYRLYGYGLWSVLLRDGTLIGCCGFRDFTESSSGRKELCGQEEAEHEGRVWNTQQDGGLPVRLELQYIVAETFRRQGYGEEMCRAALEYAYSRLHADEVWVQVREGNQASESLAKKLGFARIRTDGAGIAYFRKLWGTP